MIELTEIQWQELSGPEPIAIDPRTCEQYILVRKEIYDRMKSLLDDDSHGMYSLLADLDPEDWEEISVYQDKT